MFPAASLLVHFRQCLILTRGANEEVRIWNDQIEDNMQYVVVAMYVCCILTEYNNWTVQKWAACAHLDVCQVTHFV